MLPVRPTNRFKKDLKKAIAQGRDLTKLKKALEILSIPEPLPLEFRDHKLKGKWQDFRGIFWCKCYFYTPSDSVPIDYII